MFSRNIKSEVEEAVNAANPRSLVLDALGGRSSEEIEDAQVAIEQLRRLKACQEQGHGKYRLLFESNHEPYAVLCGRCGTGFQIIGQIPADEVPPHDRQGYIYGSEKEARAADWDEWQRQKAYNRLMEDREIERAARQRMLAAARGDVASWQERKRAKFEWEPE